MQSISVIPSEPIEAYHARSNIGSSFLKAFQRSPLHAWSAYLDPEREQADKLAFRIGRAWHCALFEPAEFSGRYAEDHTDNKLTTRAKLLARLRSGEIEAAALIGVPDDIGKTTKAGRELYSEIEARGQIALPATDLEWIKAEAGRIGARDILPADRIADVLKMAEIARAHQVSRVIFGVDLPTIDGQARIFRDDLVAGVAELSIMATDPATGVPLKIRPDYLVMPCDQFPHGVIVDGKSCQDASRDGFGRAVWNYDYGLQAALYTQVAQRTLATSGRPAFVWLAQEKTRPHAAQYFAAGDSLLEYWDGRIAELLPRVAECMASGVWPGYPATVETLALPAWAEARMAEDER